MEITLKKHRKTVQIIIQVVIWGMLFVFPFIFSFDQSGKNKWDHMLRFMWPLVFAVLVYYANYGYIINKFLFEKKVLKFFVANIIIVAVSLALLQWEHEKFVAPGIPKFSKAPPEFISMAIFVRNLITLVLVIGLSVAIKMTAHWYQTESQRKSLEKMQVETELIQLKSQLNPHFLFNTLNNIYALIAISQENAQSAVHQLSKLIRYILYESEGEKVLLSKEIDFLKNYIELMSLRLPRHVKVDVDIKQPAGDLFIAPLLIMPLVENAFKHGVSSTKPSFIEINISANDSKLFTSVRNSNFPKTDTDKTGSGIGLSNLKKRLDLIYPGKYFLESDFTPEYFASRLTIHL